MRKANIKIVEAAVAYWANFLKNQDQVVHDNGEPTQFAMMNVLSKLTGMVNYPQEAIEDFEVTLSNIIEANLNEFGRLTLGVDYHPDNNLSKALKESIKEYNSMTIFPCKTSMIVNKDVGCIDVSEGYGKPWQRIYPVVEEE